MTTFLHWLYMFYIATATAALGGGMVGVFGWFGVESNAITVVPALGLGLPWSLLLHFSIDAQPALNFVLLATMLACNAAVLHWIDKRLQITQHSR